MLSISKLAESGTETLMTFLQGRIHKIKETIGFEPKRTPEEAAKTIYQKMKMEN